MPDWERPENWKRLEDLFYRALELPPDQQRRFLDESCSGDGALRREVESLLEAAAQPPDFMAQAVGAAARDLHGRKYPPILPPGRSLNHYRIVSLAGAGGMGQVYLAEDLRLGRKVALKILVPELVGDGRSVRRFEQEALAASALNHPNIVTIYDVGEFEGTHFIAAEFIEGGTLRQRLAAGRIEIRAAVDIAIQIASALAAAHEAGIVHRDVKPENILIRPDGIAKLVDFGIAKLSQEHRLRQGPAGNSGAAPITRTGIRLGTTRYMSPEQARGLDADGRADLFSLGAVLYEMIAGRAPFDGATEGDVLAEILKTDPPPLNQLVAGVDAELARIVAKAMCKDRESRYRNARELLADLEAFRGEQEFRAKLETTPVPGPSQALPSAGARPWKRRWVLPALAAALVGVAGYGGWRLSTASVTARPRSLAILPFLNVRPDPATDFLGFSLADAVITKLGYVSALAVRPSSAIEKYRNQAVDPRQAGAALDVDTLLTGSYVREGDSLRITVQLIDVKPLNILWRDTIDIPYGNLLTVDDRVAEQIISGLKLSLSPAESAHLRLNKPSGDAAYEAYLRGVDLFSIGNYEEAIAMLEKSAAMDPAYALTWALLGQAYETNASLQFGGRGQYRKALDAYQRALRLNPALIEARVNMANLYTDTGRVEEAVPLLRSALDSNRNSASAHWELGYAYRFAGLLAESVRECERAREIDPSVKISSSAINAYFYLGQYGKWLASLPNSSAPYILFYRGFGEYYQREYARAKAHFDAAYEGAPDLLQAEVGKALSDGIANDRAAGLRLLGQTEAEIEQRGVTDAEGIYKVAQAYAVLGDRRAALRMFRRTVDGGFFCYPYFQTDPLLDSLRSEPGFDEVMQRARQRYVQFQARWAPSR